MASQTAEINFGPLSAQSDPDLLTYFYVTDQIKKLTGGAVRGASRFVVVSRPGAGKSALFEWAGSQRATMPALLIRGANHRIIPPDAAMNVDDYRTLAFGEFATAFILWANSGLKLEGQLKRKLNGFRGRKAIRSIKKFFAQDLIGVNILGNGYNLNDQDRKDYLRELRRPELRTELEELVKAISTAAAPVLILDDPEFTIASGLDELDRDNAQRLGGLLSALGQLDALGLRVLVFVREHVYRAVVDQYNDSSHFADRIQGLGWTADDLMGLLTLRLERRVRLSWNRAFSISEGELQEKVFPFLVNGPRDLLMICNHAGTRSVPIGSEDLDRAIDQSSRDRWTETRKQFTSRFPAFDKLAGSCLRLVVKEADKSTIRPGALVTLIKDQLTTPGSEIHKLRAQASWIDALPNEPHRAIELLYAAGCLGYVQDGERIYPWAGRSTDRFTLADSYFISPAFIRTL